MGRSRNLKHLNLNMCFPISTHSPESKSPPTSPPPIATITHQIHHDHDTNSSSHCPSSSPIMIKNFNSLYDPTTTFDHSFFSSSLSTTTTLSSNNEILEHEPAADFAAAFASQRFFFSTPGSSNSLIEYNTNINKYSSPLLVDKSKKKEEVVDKEEEKALFNGSVAVPTYSPDPYLDFRRSMQEMVEARPELMDVKSNWNVLHELLLCYLALNPKTTHKFILGAFADLLVSLMSF